MTQQEFIEWLNAMLNQRNWSRNQAAAKAGIDSSTLDKIVSGISRPGSRTCAALAKAFAVDEEEVFQRAGLLPKRKRLPAKVASWGERLDQLEDIDRDQTIEMIEGVLRYAESREPYVTRRRRSSGG